MGAANFSAGLSSNKGSIVGCKAVLAWALGFGGAEMSLLKRGIEWCFVNVDKICFPTWGCFGHTRMSGCHNVSNSR